MTHFEETDYRYEKFDTSIWRKVLRIVLKKKRYVLLMLFFVVFLVALDILYPFINSYAIDTFFSDNPDFTKKIYYIGGFLFIIIGYLITIAGFILMAGYVEVEVGYELRGEAFKKLQELPFAYYDKTPAGWIMARLTSDSRRLSTILSWGLVDILWGSLYMLAIIVALYIVNWKLALIITALLPVLFVVSVFFRKKILYAYREARKTNSKITAAYNEGILGIKTTKTLVLEKTKHGEFDSLCVKMRRDSLKAIIFSSLFFPIVLVISYIATGLTVRVGAGFYLNPDIVFSFATLYLFLTFTTHFFDPVMQVARILAELQQAQASAERLISLIETEPEISDKVEVIEKYGSLFAPKKENWESIKGDIEFKNVTFKYKEGETVLENFSLKIPAGTSVALVGATGSGKSTIVNLICRFYEPVSGEILIDGKDYRERSIAWLHSNLGYVLQTPHLFNGTVMDNIRYGKLDATDEEVIAAAKAVKVDEFVRELPDGYYTNVGSSGAKISVGQRQLVCFARALLADPKILILDEATSSIDTKTEVVIHEVFDTVMKGRTTFIVAHRLSTVINADIILVIDDGKVIEKGSHQELLRLKGEYYNLYKNQFISEAIEKTKY
ncbi:MAG TPA: ABC transporter ATP-binding protein [Bacilli bacterium]|jgi:ATP-binding cassette subfamily B protein|nr:ABC transporter ATP-binding protein [Bacilli bacterium]HPZ27837.1 ABC transporter ATP-binding protein [Bacilli bacterium]HQC90216.1 ABC transporter ATP-binding protein [Bacilli bacterium]